MTRDQEWHYISHICDRIRDQTVTQEQMTFLREHAHPRLLQTMTRYICLRKAGLDPQMIIHRTTSGY
jgi:hypothetical protein